MKKNKFIAVLLAATMSIPAVASCIAVAAENPLETYDEIVSEFNDEYGTSYQIATPEQLEMTGQTMDEIVDFFTEMNEEEFWNYLCDIHSAELSSLSEESAFTFDESNSVDVKVSLNSINPPVGTEATYIGKQYFYYSGSDTKSLWIEAMWSYGDGYYRYSPYLRDYSYTGDNNYPYYIPKNLNYTTQNDSREMACSFTCDRCIGNGVFDATVWTINVTFVAGGGDVWHAIEL